MKVREVIEKAGTTNTNDYSDYKDVNGIRFPYTTKGDLGNYQIELKVKDLKFNSNLGDDNFK